MKINLKFLLPFAIAVVALLYYTLYSDYVTDQAFRAVFGDDHSSTLSVECWTYNYTDNQISLIENRSGEILPANVNQLEKLKLLRGRLSEKHFIYLNGAPNNDTKNSMGNYFGNSIGLNLAESLTSIANVNYDGNPPIKCKVDRPSDFTSRALLSSFHLSNSAIIVTKTSQILSENCKDANSCLLLYKNMSVFAEIKKSELPAYKTEETPRCDLSSQYNYIKEVEKKERDALKITNDPFSLLLRVGLINGYSVCSEELFKNYVANRSCGILPKTQGQMVTDTLVVHSAFSNCVLNATREYADNIGAYF